ncbi:MAG: threonine/serine dehydratase [Actinobacteria bacterium]|nr:threonine/serine dehydratase [Actinomycetota bacterium]
MGSGEISLHRIRSAQGLIAPYIHRTALRSAGVKDLWLKCENRQITGSFKVRGALNRLLGLTQEEAERGVVAASAGNHGMGVAYAARLRGCRATVIVPRDAVHKKVEGIRAFGADVQPVDGGYEAAETEGVRLARERGAVWVSPYNDATVIAGQGTIGVELVEDLARTDNGGGCLIYVPVGGGGMAAGIGVALRSALPAARMIGVQPANSAYLYEFVHGRDPGRVVERPTLADGLSGPVEAGSITYDLVRDVVDEMQLVSEEEIERAVLWAYEAGEIIEPSAAVALAAGLRDPRKGERVVVLSGGNIDGELLARLTSEHGAAG